MKKYRTNESTERQELADCHGLNLKGNRWKPSSPERPDDVLVFLKGSHGNDDDDCSGDDDEDHGNDNDDDDNDYDCRCDDEEDDDDNE